MVRERLQLFGSPSCFKVWGMEYTERSTLYSITKIDEFRLKALLSSNAHHLRKVYLVNCYARSHTFADVSLVSSSSYSASQPLHIDTARSQRLNMRALALASIFGSNVV